MLKINAFKFQQTKTAVKILWISLKSFLFSGFFVRFFTFITTNSKIHMNFHLFHNNHKIRRAKSLFFTLNSRFDLKRCAVLAYLNKDFFYFGKRKKNHKREWERESTMSVVAFILVYSQNEKIEKQNCF